MYLPPWQWQALYGKSETDRQHPRRRTRHQLRRWSWSTLSWKHFAYPWRSLPTVSRPVNLLIWMSFMVTVLYVSPLTAEQLEIRSVTDAKHLGCPIISRTQSVQQSDGSSQLQVVEEIRRTFPPDITDFTFEGLVVEDLDVEVLAGTPFTERERVLLGNGSIYTYGSKAPPSPLTTVRRAFVFRASNPSKDCLSLRIPGSTAPRRRSPWFRVCNWAPYWCTYFTKSQALPAVATIQCRFQCCARNTHTKPVNRASNA